ncbi:lactonase family protein [Paenibacillus sp. YN15]|uniref:lactonase family protein n=1 Tax=Paenibacillus sp. YN15 TaxID=1742774 RepID=UPI00215D116A|nr:lactonase family protein [Paenibacillus sp. YN15]
MRDIICEVIHLENSSNKRIFAFIGSYAEAEEDGVYVCLFHPEHGELTVTDRIQSLKNPTFLDVDPEKRILYVLSEGQTGGRSGVAAAFSIDPEKGKLTGLNRERTVDSPICHIQLDKSRRCLFTASYHGGLVGVNAVLEDGRIGPSAQVIAHTGSSILPAQTQARAHSVFVDPDNRFAVVCDLGMDKIVSYRIDPEGPSLTEAASVELPPGSGPRHFAFHPKLAMGYSINELSSTITVFRYDRTSGVLTPVQTVSTLPGDFTGESATADIHISGDGRFLYGSNRGHDSIAVFAVSLADGTLTPVEYIPTQGGHPRNFALSLDDRLLLAANRDGNNIVVFNRDGETGRLSANGRSLTLPKPVCIKFADLS